MIYLLLALSFMKIGLFAFGGGYAMIPLMQSEIEAYGWIGAREFADIVAISQMTPGPVAVNAATYIGYRVAGFAGSAAATIGVSIPSFVIIILIAQFLRKFKENAIVRSILDSIRPVTVGLVAAAVYFFAELSVLQHPLGLDSIGGFLFGGDVPNMQAFALNPGGTAVFAIILAAVLKFRLHPVPAVLISTALGIVLM